MEQDWTKIKTYTKPIEAEIIKQMLEANGVLAVVLNKQDSSYFFGRIELYVSEEMKGKALSLIDDHGSLLLEGENAD